VDPHRFLELRRDAQQRVERRHRILEHHRDAVTAELAQLVRAHPGNLAALKTD